MVAALSLPGAAVVTLAAGALFGLGSGTLIVSSASSIGATLAGRPGRQRDRDGLGRHAMSRLSHQYDLKNMIDLARHLLPTPPVPVRWRRRMLALGSGAVIEPTLQAGFDHRTPAWHQAPSKMAEGAGA